MDHVDTSVLNQKLELIHWLSAVEDVAIIQKMMDLKNEQSDDWWDIISESEKQSIELGIIDADMGRLHDHSEVRKIYEKWL